MGSEGQRAAALGFVYWLALVLVLEPGNLMRAGGGLPLGQEIARFLGAASLGSVATVAVFALVRRWPVEDWGAGRRILLHLAADAGIAVVMIVVAGLLAALLLSEDRRPLLAALGAQLAADGPILFFCLVLLTAIAHGLRARDVRASGASGYLSSVPVKLRGKTEIVDLAEVAWIETQGNYLALHAGGATHLVRETSRRFEARLDPERFLRIHRQTIVAVDAVKRVEALSSGDATVTLKDGTELRASRSFRDALRARLDQSPSVRP